MIEHLHPLVSPCIGEPQCAVGIPCVSALKWTRGSRVCLRAEVSRFYVLFHSLTIILLPNYYYLVLVVVMPDMCDPFPFLSVCTTTLCGSSLHLRPLSLEYSPGLPKLLSLTGEVGENVPWRPLTATPNTPHICLLRSPSTSFKKIHAVVEIIFLSGAGS